MKVVFTVMLGKKSNNLLFLQGTFSLIVEAWHGNQSSHSGGEHLICNSTFVIFNYHCVVINSITRAIKHWHCLTLRV